MTGKHTDLGRLFEEYDNYASEVPFEMYDVKEILSEKVRALLTRRGTKARDFVDIFFISKNLGVRPADVEACMTKKMNYSLGQFERYRENLEEKKRLLSSGRIFEWSDEKGLLLEEIDEEEFDGFIKELSEYLEEFVKKLGIRVS